MRPPRPVLFALLALASGCAPDMTPSSLVVRSRALVANIAVVSEPTRSNPAPGEATDVQVFFGDPGAKPERTWAMIVCEPIATTFGTALCTSFTPEDLIASSIVTTPSTETPSISFTVPAEADLLPETTELLMVGAFCSGGVIDLEAMFAYFADLAEGTAHGAPPVCTDGIGDGELATLRIPLMLDGPPNTQPVIDSIRRSGAAFLDAAPPEAPATGCVSLGGAVPTMQVTETELTLEVIVAPDSAETFDEVDPETGQVTQVTESLQIEYAVTAGELDRTFGFIDPGEMTDRDSVGWELPPAGDVPSDGLLVRFYFDIRDGRGGTAFAERAICIVPNVGG